MDNLQLHSEWCAAGLRTHEIMHAISSRSTFYIRDFDPYGGSSQMICSLKYMQATLTLPVSHTNLPELVIKTLIIFGWLKHLSPF